MTNLVVLTGAGISAESGIATFRAGSGLWHQHDVMKVASPEGFATDPKLVHDFYNSRRAELKTVEPNAGHEAIARLEQEWIAANIGGFILVTQNVDNLHERAGSENLAHMHGELTSIRCTVCSHSERTEEDTGNHSRCIKCGEQMRPDIVWFGEYPKYLDELEQVLDNTDVLLIIGTSGNVMPASLFPTAVRMAKPDADIIEVNPSPTGNEAFNRVVQGTAVEALPDLVNELLAKYAK